MTNEHNNNYHHDRNLNSTNNHAANHGQAILMADREQNQMHTNRSPKGTERKWHESKNIWNWKFQAHIMMLCQKVHWVVSPPALFFHFFLKRDWSMAFGPLFAFCIYNDSRSLDLFLAISVGGLFCGLFKHLIRSPRPFWIVQHIFLRHGVEEMSWSTPSAHAAIQGAITAVLLFYNPRSIANWTINLLLLGFCMFSRIYLAMHWMQDVCSGAVIGVIAALAVCLSRANGRLVHLAEITSPFGGLIYLAFGTIYLLITLSLVLILSRISEHDPVPHKIMFRYKMGIAQALGNLGKSKEYANRRRSLDSPQKSLTMSESEKTALPDPEVDSSGSCTININAESSPTASEICSYEIIIENKTHADVEHVGDVSQEQKERDVENSNTSRQISAEEFQSQARNQESEKSVESTSSQNVGKQANESSGSNSDDQIEHDGEELQTRQDTEQLLCEGFSFNPDTKIRFWYNAVNVFGTYCGVALYATLAGTGNIEFKPRLNWLAAIYATGISFSIIVYTRTILRSMLRRNRFNVLRIGVYFLVGLCTYGLFPLSYLYLTELTN